MTLNIFDYMSIGVFLFLIVKKVDEDVISNDFKIGILGFKYWKAVGQFILNTEI